jgi:hypothetical protein
VSTWRRWAIGALGAAGAGAGLALARSRAARPAPARPGPQPPPPPDAAEAPIPPADDPRAALDAARERLRRRADALRREIEGGPPAGEPPS